MELQQLKLIATAASSIISIPESKKKPHENEVQPCCAKTTTTTSKSFGDDVLVKESSRFSLTVVFGRRDLEDAVAVRPWFCGDEVQRQDARVKEEVENCEEEAISWKEIMLKSFARMDKDISEVIHGVNNNVLVFDPVFSSCSFAIAEVSVAASLPEMPEASITNYVLLAEFHEKAFINKGCNSSFVALLPKVADPQELNDFRPISLIGVVYKVIAKVLANRINPTLPSIVSPMQSAFVEGRYILDGPLMVSEIISWAKSVKKEIFIFKVDFQKAYDSVSWNFLISNLRSMGFPKNGGNG
ncbi:uncharacterized protein LOC110924301 [Helianthus annuus]|uniref:uncharacterized protein LOC110924301 n=1 Tax=Helianthus annuus TaxID=4232 RepID=UPI000B909FB8|nr:uncharacterized protein LOC110924301 [Helianthus annuus]